MAEVTKQPDGSAEITVTQSDITGLKALANQHLPFLKKVEGFFSADVAPELGEAETFLKGLVSNQDTTLTVSASEAQKLRGLLQAHIPDFNQVLSIVESQAVRSLVNLAKDLL